MATRSKGGSPPKAKKRKGGRPSSVVNIDNIMELDPSKPLSDKHEQALAFILSIKASQSTGPQKLIEVKTGGPQPVTYAPVTVARRQVTPRTLRKHTKELKEHVKLVAGKSNEALLCQVLHIVKTKKRETILKNFKTTLSIPASHLAAMKSTLNLSWNTTQEIKRWLKTFKVQLASEGKARDVTKEWIGTGLRAEEIPASIMTGKKILVELRAWCYI